MNKELLIIIGVLLCLLIFAIQKEYTEHNDAYLLNKAEDEDSLNISLRKLEKCLDYEKKTIKWRRVFIATIVSIILIFGLYHQRMPKADELLVYLVFIFLMFIIMWKNYVSRTVFGAVLYGKDNIKNIRKRIKNLYFNKWQTIL